MQSVGVKINSSSIAKKIESAFKEKSKVIAQSRAYNLFKRAKNTMLKEFDEHPVTLEILAGSRAINFSNTLDGYGNLYSFLGFESGREPIEPLRNLLESTTFNKTAFRNMAWYFKISFPSKEEIRKVTPMDWEVGNSWAESIENGLSNLSFYMYKRSQASRSGQGIQAGWPINEDLIFTKTKYISKILNNFRYKINNSTTNEY